MKQIHLVLPDDIAELLEKLRLRDGIKASKTAVIIACIRDKAKRRGFIDE